MPIVPRTEADSAPPAAKRIVGGSGGASSAAVEPFQQQRMDQVKRQWRLPLRALGFNLHEASELAAVGAGAGEHAAYMSGEQSGSGWPVGATSLKEDLL